jgi:hypothetical protein
MVCILNSCHYILSILFSSQMENLHVSVPFQKPVRMLKHIRHSNPKLWVFQQNLSLRFIWNTSFWYLKLRKISMWVLWKPNRKLLLWLQKYYMHSTLKTNFFCQCSKWWQIVRSFTSMIHDQPINSTEFQTCLYANDFCHGVFSWLITSMLTFQNR